jgi:hypothetical protein
MHVQARLYTLYLGTPIVCFMSSIELAHNSYAHKGSYTTFRLLHQPWQRA